MRHQWPSVAAMPLGFWRWPHVSPTTEWADHADGSIGVETDFLDRFEGLRAQVGFALPITSGYRSPAHNAAVSTTGDDGPHVLARAADIRVYGVRAFQVIAAAIACGFTGIGVQQKGDQGQRYVHVDDLPEAPGRPRPTVWTY